MMSLLDERNEAGELTAMALAIDALLDHGCDCGTDEPGMCLACLCSEALRVERARAERGERAAKKLARELARLDDGPGVGGLKLAATVPY